jgi:hypothetical protein
MEAIRAACEELRSAGYAFVTHRDAARAFA